MIKKERIMGSEVKFAFSSPLEAVRDFFGAVERPPATIPLFSREYRKFRSETTGKRGVKWEAIMSGAKKEQVGLQRAKERRKGSAW